MREIVSAIGERSLIGQVTFPLQFSRVIPTDSLCWLRPRKAPFFSRKFSSPSIHRENDDL